jgi:hypothetical protein
MSAMPTFPVIEMSQPDIRFLSGGICEERIGGEPKPPRRDGKSKEAASEGCLKGPIYFLKELRKMVGMECMTRHAGQILGKP